MDDESIMTGLTAGRPEAIGDLYDRYGSAVYALARRITADSAMAEDITQETFVKVWRHADRYDPERGRLATWILHIAYTTTIDAMRARRRWPVPVVEPSEELAAEPGADPAAQAELAILGEDVRRALLRLPPEQRQALELAYFGALSQSEIGQRLGIPLGTVKSRVRLGLTALRRILLEPRASESRSSDPRSKEVEGRARLSPR